MANNIDPDQKLLSAASNWICTVCSGVSVPILRLITVMSSFTNEYIVLSENQIGMKICAVVERCVAWSFIYDSLMIFFLSFP